MPAATDRSRNDVRRKLGVFVCVAALVLGATAPAGAKPTASGSTAATAGSCSVTPNPAKVGGTYTVTGTKLGANRIVNVFVTDPKGTQWGSVMSDAYGTAKYVGVASVAGSYSVTIRDNSRKSLLLASCGFRAA